MSLTMLLAGCGTSGPGRVLELPPQTVEDRRLQTRRFVGITETDLLAACAGVLQDLGFNLDESEADLGLLVASKEASARNTGHTTLATLLNIFVDMDIDVDEEQRIRASLITTPDPERQDSFRVRITFQRVVWNTAKEVSKREALTESELYQRFFERLSKSVFLEAHSI